jgi:hypothetical protein
MAWNGSLGDAAQGQTVLGQEVISVCDPQQPVSVDAALVTLERALDALNAADVASMPASVRAQALRVGLCAAAVRNYSMYCHRQVSCG